MARINPIISSVDRGFLDSLCGPFLVQTNSGVIYKFLNRTDGAIFWSKSLNNGYSFDPVTFDNIVDGNTNSLISVWYDRWSGLNSDIIHIAHANPGDDDVFYRTFNPSTNTLSSAVTIYAGTIAGNSNNTLAITRAKGGNIAIYGSLNNSSNQMVFAVSSSSWTAYTGSSPQLPFQFVGAADYNHIILLPEQGSNDNQDLCLIRHTRLGFIDKYHWDNSTLTWSSSSIASPTNFQDPINYFPAMSAFPDNVNNQNVLLYWPQSFNDVAVLKCCTLTSSSITFKTDVVTGNSFSGLAALSINTNDNTWYAYYGGDNSLAGSPGNLYFKSSSNSGSTWSSPINLFTYNIPSYFLPSGSGPYGQLRFLEPIKITQNLNPTVMFGVSQFSGGSEKLLGISLSYPSDGGSIVIS